MHINKNRPISVGASTELLNAARKHGVAMMVQTSWPMADLFGLTRAQNKAYMLDLIEQAALTAKDDDVLDEIYDLED